MPKKIDKKILIVEDDEDFISILKTKFSAEGFSVVTAQNGEEGASKAETESPDLILSDVLLPKLNGVLMGQKIRELKIDTPIFYLTNIKEETHEEELKKVGKYDYLIKSDLRIGEIVEKVKKKLGVN